MNTRLKHPFETCLCSISETAPPRAAHERVGVSGKCAVWNNEHPPCEAKFHLYGKAPT